MCFLFDSGFKWRKCIDGFIKLAQIHTFNKQTNLPIPDAERYRV